MENKYDQRHPLDFWLIPGLFSPWLVSSYGNYQIWTPINYSCLKDGTNPLSICQSLTCLWVFKSYPRHRCNNSPFELQKIFWRACLITLILSITKITNITLYIFNSNWVNLRGLLFVILSPLFFRFSIDRVLWKKMWKKLWKLLMWWYCMFNF